MMTPRILFSVLCLATVAAFLISIVCLPFGPMFVYDANVQALRSIPAEQGRRVSSTIQTLVAYASWPLLATNLGWVVAFFVIRDRKARPADPAD